MPTIPSAAPLPSSSTGPAPAQRAADVARNVALAGPTGSVAPQAAISSFGSRLARADSAAAAAHAGLTHKQLGAKVQANIERINYPLTLENKARIALEQPDPADAAALASAAAATAYIDDLTGPNPFAGLPREQLWTIANDETGAFTTNEKYAAYRQAYEEEQVWRRQAVAEAMREYSETGKLTNFFQSVLDHYEGLPQAEQALYPQDYAADLREKIKLDFNYFTHIPNGLAGHAPGSLADVLGTALPGMLARQ